MGNSIGPALQSQPKMTKGQLQRQHCRAKQESESNHKKAWIKIHDARETIDVPVIHAGCHWKKHRLNNQTWSQPSTSPRHIKLGFAALTICTAKLKPEPMVTEQPSLSQSQHEAAHQKFPRNWKKLAKTKIEIPNINFVQNRLCF
jgi:hypothetical protein